MANRLLRFMTILAVPAVILGLALWLHFKIGSGEIWMHAKVFFVILVIAYHHVCWSLLKNFRKGINTHSGVWYRWFNEAPVLLMLIVTALVVIKP
jgi:putative membrane protein